MAEPDPLFVLCLNNISYGPGGGYPQLGLFSIYRLIHVDTATSYILQGYPDMAWWYERFERING